MRSPADHREIITLTTDFGDGSPYVAEMKGVILSINPSALLVDLTHSIGAQDVRQGSQVLAQVAPRFPAHAIHVAVVDPGVGTSRAIVYAEIAGRRFVGPDNGLFSRLAQIEPPSKMIHVANPQYWLADVSSTFHGRDIMAPVAAHLSLGLVPEQLGPPHASLFQLDWPEVRQVPDKLEGEIVSIDSFGNLVTNISREMLAAAPRDDSVVITCDDHETHGIFATYGDQPTMTLIALIGSSEFLELAIVDDSAAAMLGVAVGAQVVVKW